MNRKIFISVAFILAALSLASCQREPAVEPLTEADKTIPSYHVPREKAIAELNSFLDGYIPRQRGLQIETLVHCNMGNGRSTNGYYASTVFDTTKVMDEDGHILPVAPSNPRYKYCKNYKTIRYDKPLN